MSVSGVVFAFSSRLISQDAVGWSFGSGMVRGEIVGREGGLSGDSELVNLYSRTGQRILLSVVIEFQLSESFV